MDETQKTQQGDDTYTIQITSLEQENPEFVTTSLEKDDNGEMHIISTDDLETTGGDPGEMKSDGNAPILIAPNPQSGNGETPPDMPEGGEGGTPPDGGQSGGSSSSSVTWTGATEITSGGTYSNQTYTSTTTNQNALLIDTDENVTLNNATVTKSGNGDGGDNSSFYGTNAGVLVKGGSTTTINGGTVTTSASGANGVFSYGGNGGQNGAAGDGTTVVISDVTINTTGDASGGIMTTGGGITKASNLTITTTGQSSAPIRSDRGGGTVSVSGGSYTSNGLGSPAIYSTADITVENATLTSNLSEGVCIEGQNSVALTNCTLTANNTKTNGNAQFLDTVILYQSMSGDSASGTATFSMTGGKLVNKSGHVFHVTNTNAVINLNDVDIEDIGSGVLLSVSDDGWSGASNVATLNASGQELTGDILVGDDSTLTLNLTDGSTFNGNISGAITNNAGTTVSSEIGTVNVSLDADSKWYLDGDVYISSFTGTAANVITNGHTLYVNNVALDGTTESDEPTPSTVVTALNIGNIVNDTLVTGSEGNDSIINVGSNVTVNALGGNDTVNNWSDNVTINGGDGNDSIANTGDHVTVSGGKGDDSIVNEHAYNVTLDGGAGNDSIVVISGNQTTINGGAGNDTILGSLLNNSWAMGGYANINGGDGDDFIDPVFSDSASILGDAGNDTIINEGNDTTINGGAGNDVISLHGASVQGNIIKFDANGGNDIVYGVNETTTVSLTAGTVYDLANDGDNLILTVGRNNITVAGGASLSSLNVINYEVSALNINNTVNATLVTGTELDDTIINGGSNATIGGKAGNDSITNNGARSVINGETGNDTLRNSGTNSTLLGNTGDDGLINTADTVSVDGSYGNDTIANNGSYVTISPGVGNDFITNTGNNVVINYAGGLDSISGFNNTSTLSIAGGGSYSTLEGITNVLVFIDDNAAVLKNALLNTDTLHINGDTVAVGNAIELGVDTGSVSVSRNNVSVKGTAKNDTITISGSNDTIDALGGDDLIRIKRGDREFINTGDGNDTINGIADGDDWGTGGYATVLGGAGNDLLNVGYSNSASIDGGDGNDTIYASGNRATINGGAGSNLVSIMPASLDADNQCTNIVLSGNTTVQGFKTGFGNGSDTIYVKEGSDPGVDFKAGGLTFYSDKDSLTLDDVDDTAKVNLYYEASKGTRRGIFIADNNLYSVASSDLSVKSGEEVYFVGATASRNHGVDFSGVSSNLNVTLDTDYGATNASMWINNVYSIRGGAGNTTITGSAESDTIIAGTGRTTINGAGGNDRISLGSAQALVNFTSGGGNDSIYGFNANSTISIGGASYTSATSGSNLILTVGSDKITLFGAGNMESPHILGTLAGGGSSTTSGGSSSSTTSGGSSSSTTSGGSSSSTTSGGSSSSTTSGGSSSSTTSGGSSSSTTSGGSSSSTTSGGSSSSTTSGGSSSSTTSGGSSTSSVVSGGTSTSSVVSGGTSTSSVVSGGTSTSSVVSGGTSTSSVVSGGTSTSSVVSGGTSTSSVVSGGTSTATTPAFDYVYTGGDDIIIDYTAGDKIALGTYPTGGTYVDGNFVLSSADGNLVVYDALNTVIEFTDGAGNDFIKAYAGTNPGVIDGRNTSGFELVAGSDAGADLIFAGSDGSSLWGGFGSGADTLIGGAGTDVFAAGKYQGADLIGNAQTKDIINVTDATLSDIVATAEQNGVVAVTFNNGNVIAEQSAEVLSAAFQLADGSKWRYNHATKGWQSA